MTLFEVYHQTLASHEVDDFSLREWLRFIHHYSSMNDLVLHWHEPFEKNHLFEEGLQRLKTGYPVAYLTKETTFLGQSFYVDERVLIPRPETEELVMLTLRLMKTHHITPESFIDLGTGSGVLALMMKHYFPDAFVVGVDQSVAALEVARLNASKKKLDVIWIHSDWFQKIPPSMAFNVVLANPPYIGQQETIDSSVWSFEPHSALIASPPTKHYESILVQCLAYLRRPSLIVFEIAPELENSLRDILHRMSLTIYGFEKDLNQKIRMLWILVK